MNEILKHYELARLWKIDGMWHALLSPDGYKVRLYAEHPDMATAVRLAHEPPECMALKKPPVKPTLLMAATMETN